MITKVQQVSDLKLLMQALADAKLIVANKEQKTNYSINVSKVQGDKITKITEQEASGKNLANVIDVSFNTLGSKYFIVYNGQEGLQGEQGNEGEQGDKGRAGFDGLVTQRKILVIANDDETDDNEYAVWSAYRGKVLRDFLDSLSEIIISGDTYDLLFRDERFIELEFNTRADNQDITIVNYDTSDHKRYIKYWTFEDDGSIAEYFVKEGDDYIKLENFDVWQDYYLSDELDECYTRELITTIINEETGESTSEYVYTKVNKPTWMYLEFETVVEDTKSNIINSTKELSGDDDDHYVPPTPEDEEIVISHISISSITIDGQNEITIRSDINNIITKTVSILPLDYINSPIGIEYDEEMVKVFEDGRIMALDNPGQTDVKIYSIEDPSISVLVHLNIVVLIKSISFESMTINGYPSETEKVQLQPIIYPNDATNQILKYTIIDEDYKEVGFDDVYVLDEETNNISLKTEGQKVYIKENGEYKEVTINNLTDDYQLLVDGFAIYSKDDDVLPPLYIENDEVIATVDNEGKLTLIKEGTVQVKAEAQDGSGISSIVTVNVLTKSTDIVIDGMYTKDVEIEEDGETETITMNYYDILIDVTGNSRFMNTINVNLVPEDTSNKNLVWSFETPTQDRYLLVSDDTLSAQIRVTSYDEPIVLIIESEDGGVKKTINLIGKVPVTNIDLDKELLTLDLGDEYTLHADVYPNNADNKELKWTISNPLIADLVVSEDTHSCKVITRNGGTAEITAEATDGSRTSITCTLESVILITDIRLNNGQKMVVYSGQTYDIPYEIIPNDAFNKVLKWKSTKEDGGISIVGTTGKFMASQPCIGKIYAMAQDNGGVIASMDVEVLKASEELRINDDPNDNVNEDTYQAIASSSEMVISDYTLNLKVNDNYTLIAAVYPDNATYQVLNYESSDEEICEIDNNGNITALKPGTAVITISTNDDEGHKLSGSCIVNIN